MDKLGGWIDARKVAVTIAILGLLIACNPGAIEAVETSTSTQPVTEERSATIESPVGTTSPALPTNLPVLPTPEGQLLLNADFESGMGSWEPRFGDFLPSMESPHSGRVSGRLMASSVDAHGDFSALVGQCVPLTAVGGGSVEDDYARLELRVFINTSPGGTYVNLSGVFTDDDRCRGNQLGTFSIPVAHEEGWRVVTGVIDIPVGAGSLDFLISCAGDGPDASILVDDVHLSPLDLP